jgi:hypothetical protein
MVCGSDSLSALGRGLVILLAFPMMLFEAWQVAKCSLPDGIVNFSGDSSASASVQRGACYWELLELEVSWIGCLMGHFAITSGQLLRLTLLRWTGVRLGLLQSFGFYYSFLCGRFTLEWIYPLQWLLMFFYDSLKYARVLLLFSSVSELRVRWIGFPMGRCNTRLGLELWWSLLIWTHVRLRLY